mgnify:FL=1
MNYRLNYDLQKDGKNNTKTAKISNLPRSIAKESIHLEVFDTWLKFPFGPIMSPRPGPTLDIAVAAPETADKKSRPVIDNSIDIIKNKNKYEKIKIITELMKFSSIFLLL